MSVEYLDAIAPALTAVIGFVLAEAKNADRGTVPGAARAAIMRWIDSLGTDASKKNADQKAIWHMA